MTTTQLKSTARSASSQTANAVASYIDALQQQPARPLLVHEKTSPSVQHYFAKTHHKAFRQPSTLTKTSYPMGMSRTTFIAGSQAPLRVYTRSLSTIENGSHQDAVTHHHTISSLSNTHSSSQTQKTAFLHVHSQPHATRIKSQVQPMVSPYTLSAGTLIPATLLTGINSDLPGTVIAKVREDVFDSATGNDCLIPQGSTLIGVYDSRISYGQTRVLMVWSRLIFPNGEFIDLAGQPGVDLLGLAGLHDLVNNHYVKLFGSALLLSVFGAAGQLSQPRTTGNQLSLQQVLYASIGQQLSQTAAQLMQKNLTIQPTLKIRPGDKFNVLLTRDVVFPGPYVFHPVIKAYSR